MKQKGYFKHPSGMLFAAVLCLALSVTAYAADLPNGGNNCSITIDNPVNGVTYTAYKIFDVASDLGGTSYSYSIGTGDQWYTYVKSYADRTDSGLIISQPSAENVCSVVTADFSAGDFAAYLSENQNPPGGVELIRVGEGKAAIASVTGLPQGYYFVKGSYGALCNLTTSDAYVVIHDKNDIPLLKTVEGADKAAKPENEGVQVGQILTYTITGAVPDTGGLEDYVYKIGDIMEEGLTFNRDVSVSIGGVGVVPREETDAQAMLTGNRIRYRENGFELSLDVKNKSYGAPIIITYTATVNERAVGQVMENNALLTYGRNPFNTTDSTPQTVRVFSAIINIDKYKKNPADENDKAVKLGGAKFVLRRGGAGDGKYYKGIFKEGGESGALTDIEWVNNIDDATTVVTNANGAASFEGLKNGIYYLVETEAPEDYNLLKNPVEIVVSGSASAGLTVVAEIANSEGTELPTTGGSGTAIFYLAGIILILASLAFLVIRRYKHKRRK